MALGRDASVRQTIVARFQMQLEELLLSEGVPEKSSQSFWLSQLCGLSIQVNFLCCEDPPLVNDERLHFELGEHANGPPNPHVVELLQ